MNAPLLSGPEQPAVRQNVSDLRRIDPALYFDRHPTRIGGVLFLVGLLQRLRVYDLFSEFDLASMGLSGWRLALRLARECLMPMSDAVRDPLWRALEELAVGEPNGEERGSPVADWFAPTDWLPFLSGMEGDWRCVLVEGKTRVWAEPLGFVLAETPTEVEAIARRYGISLAERIAMPDGPNVLGWANCLLHSVRAIAMALLEQKVIFDLETALLRKNGTFTLTRTHLDLFLPLAAVDVRVRRAGLDIDPGWVPQLGRIVTFHYE